MKTSVEAELGKPERPLPQTPLRALRKGGPCVQESNLHNPTKSYPFESSGG